MDAAEVGLRGAHTNFTPNDSVKSEALGEGRGGPGVVQGCFWLKTRPELIHLGPPADFSLGWVGEEPESNVETQLKRRRWRGAYGQSAVGVFKPFLTVEPGVAGQTPSPSQFVPGSSKTG